MTYKLDQRTGDVTWVYTSTARAIFEDNQLLPDKVVWDYVNEAMLLPHEARADACEAKLKQYNLTKDVWPIDPKDLGMQSIYLIQCPGAVLKILFNNLWPAVLELEKQYPDIRYTTFLEEVMLEMAKVVDAITEDETRALTIKVTTELMRAQSQEYYTRIYGEE